MRLWNLLDNPVYYSPRNAESHFPDYAIKAAERGRRCDMEISLLGSNVANRAIRDFERSARRHGGDQVGLERLTEYHNAIDGYQRILRRMHARRRNQWMFVMVVGLAVSLECRRGEYR